MSNLDPTKKPKTSGIAVLAVFAGLGCIVAAFIDAHPTWTILAYVFSMFGWSNTGMAVGEHKGARKARRDFERAGRWN